MLTTINTYTIELLGSGKQMINTIITIGIDPGLTGGIVILRNGSDIINKYIMPTKDKYLDLVSIRELFTWIKTMYLIEDIQLGVYLENVHSMPKQGVASSFKFGRVFGGLEGILTGLKIPFHLVSPQAWQKVLHEGIDRKEIPDPKERSIMVANRLYESGDFRATTRCSVPHKGLVDAYLIALYGYKQLSMEVVK